MKHILKLSSVLLILCSLFINLHNCTFAADSNDEKTYNLKFRQVINLTADMQKEADFAKVKTIAKETGWTYNASKNRLERIVVYKNLANLEIKINGSKVKYKNGKIRTPLLNNSAVITMRNKTTNSEYTQIISEVSSDDVLIIDMDITPMFVVNNDNAAKK